MRPPGRHATTPSSCFLDAGEMVGFDPDLGAAGGTRRRMLRQSPSSSEDISKRLEEQKSERNGSHYSMMVERLRGASPDVEGGR